MGVPSMCISAFVRKRENREVRGVERGEREAAVMGEKKCLGIRRTVLGVGLALLVLGGQGAFAEEKILKVAQGADITNLDPQKISDIPTANVVRQIYNGLVKVDKENNIQPDLAESWENVDEKTWVFHLKKGVLFHNGDELKASDVKFTFDRIMNPETKSTGMTHVKEIQSVEVVDPFTVKLILKRPFSPLITNLSRYEVVILNERAVTEAGVDYAKKPVGTGPFKFVEWIPGDKVTLAKFDQYFEGAPKIDGVVYRAIPEDATRVIELESGGVDLVAPPFPPQDFAAMKERKDMTTHETLAQSTIFVGFNTTAKPFDNKLVRQAVNYAIDKQAIIDTIYSGLASPSHGPLSPRVSGYDSSLPPAYPYDPEKARALLKEAGFPDGFKTWIWANPTTERKMICEMVQQYLAEVGISVEIELIEWGAFLAATGRGAKGMYTLGWIGTGDADGGLYPRFHSSNIGGINRNYWSSPKVDELLDKARTSMNAEERKAIYNEVQHIVVEEAPELFLAVQIETAVSKPYVKGYELYPNRIVPLKNVFFEN